MMVQMEFGRAVASAIFQADMTLLGAVLVSVSLVQVQGPSRGDRSEGLDSGLRRIRRSQLLRSLGVLAVFLGASAVVAATSMIVGMALLGGAAVALFGTGLLVFLGLLFRVLRSMEGAK